MKTIGQLVREARGEVTPAKYARTLKIGKAKLNQIERDQPLVITVENRDKLAKAGIAIPAKLLEKHNYVAAACAKAKNWSKDFRTKIEAGQLPLSPELQAASDAVDKELLEHGTVGGIPVDTSKMVGATKPKKKAAKRKPKAAHSKTLQSTLPNFLGQLNNARIEEMIAERIVQRLQAAIDQKVEMIFLGNKLA